MATAFDTPVDPFAGPFADLPTQFLEASTRALSASAGVVEPPIAGYDDLTADEVIAKLPEQPQAALAQIAVYEKAKENSATVLQRVAALTGPEPAPGYDAL